MNKQLKKYDKKQQKHAKTNKQTTATNKKTADKKINDCYSFLVGLKRT